MTPKYGWYCQIQIAKMRHCKTLQQPAVENANKHAKIRSLRSHSQSHSHKFKQFEMFVVVAQRPMELRAPWLSKYQRLLGSF